MSNPILAIEYISTVLLLRRLSDAKGTSDWDDVVALVAAGDPGAIAQRMQVVQVEYGIGASPDMASPSTWRDGTTLQSVLLDVAELGITDRNADVLGDLFEYILNHLSTAGHFGQFRTPRHLIQFMTQAVNPKLGEVVLDPAVGTAGFLVAVHEHRGGESEPYIGNEVDNTIVRVARTNTLLHGMTGARIIHGDSFGTAERDADVILANPPFAGNVVAARVAGYESRTLKSELLFLELMMKRLRTGGRAGVVVPTSVLTSGSGGALWVRRQLVENYQLTAVIELPSGIFRPYTDVKTGLLFWTAAPAKDEVIMIRVEADGYSLDDKRIPTDVTDLPAALAVMRGISESDVAHARVPRTEIAENDYRLSPSRYIAHDAVAIRDFEAVNLGAAIARVRDALSQFEAEFAVLEGLNS